MTSILIKLALLAMALPNTVSAQELMDCNLKTITDDCKSLKTENPNLVDPWDQEAKLLNSATSYSPTSGGYGFGTGALQMESEDPELKKLQIEMSDLALRAQMDLVSNLKTGSSIFKFAVTSPMNLNALALANNSSSSQIMFGPPPVFYLPWPPDKEDAKTQPVSFEKLKSEYLDKLPQSESDLLQKKLKPLLENSEKQGKLYEEQRKKQTRKNQELATTTPPKNPEIEVKKEYQMDRFKTMFNEAKRLLIAELKERPGTVDPKSLEIFLKKMELIKLNESVENATCLADNMNANYDPMTLTVTMCSGMSTVPDENLLLVIGHELGHALDPCRCRLAVHKVNMDVSNFSSLVKWDERAIDSDIQKNYPEKWKKDTYAGGLNVLFQDSSLKAAEFGTVTKVLDPVTGTYPFDTTLRCLRDNHGFAYETGGVEALVKKKVSRNPQISTDSDRKKYLADCRNEDGSEMSESMSDVFGAKVLGRYLRENPRKRSKEDLANAMYFFSESACLGKPRRKGTHVPSRERIEKIILAEPSISKAYNCKPHPKYFCMNKFGSIGPNSTDSENLKSGAKR